MQITEHNAMGTTGFSIIQQVKGKQYKFHAHKHGLCWDKEYDYQVITKCQAGFLLYQQENLSYVILLQVIRQTNCILCNLNRKAVFI